LICPSLLTPWANADVPKKYFKTLFTLSSSSSSNVTSTKIWPSTYLSLKFYRWMYEYLKNCTAKAQIKNASRLLTLSMYSRECLDDILNEVDEFEYNSQDLPSILRLQFHFLGIQMVHYN